MLFSLSLKQVLNVYFKATVIYIFVHRGSGGRGALLSKHICLGGGAHNYKVTKLHKSLRGT